MKFSGVLIASDYDGTLVPHTKDITAGVRQALKYFISEGGRFTVSTGRCCQGFHAYDPEIINAPVILANGGMMFDYGRSEIFTFDGLGHDSDDDIRRVMDTFRGIAVCLYPFSGIRVINPNASMYGNLTSQDIAFSEITDPSQADAPRAKVMFRSDGETIAAVQRFISAYCPSLSYIPTTGGALEVLKPGVNKGTALLKLGEHFGISRENLCAVGDGYNDTDMLGVAAHAFVPANGDAPALAAAGCIVRSNEEDAIANVIEILDRLY